MTDSGLVDVHSLLWITRTSGEDLNAASMLCEHSLVL